jgi:hypothetical protein
MPLWEVALTSGANGHDVLEADGQLLLTQYDQSTLALIDPSDGSPIGSVDLADEADMDGLPEADTMALVDGRVFVALQRFDRPDSWAPQAGRLVEVDPVAGVVVGSVEVGLSPRLHARSSDPQTAVVVTGTFGQPDGALSVFDGAFMRDVVTEQALGADMGAYAETESTGVLLGSDFALDGMARLWCIDWATERILEGPIQAAGYADVVTGAGLAWVAVRRGWGGGESSGVMRINLDTCAMEGALLHTDLEPFSLAWNDEGT